MIVKHTNPCGAAERRDARGGVGGGAGGRSRSRRSAASSPSPARSTTRRRRASPSIFLEVVVAPAFSPAAREILAAKPNLRLVEDPSIGRARRPGPIRSARSGRPAARSSSARPTPRPTTPATWQVATTRHPTDEERRDLDLAWRLVRAVTSNAIVLVRDGALVGLGSGQMSRVDAARQAVEKAVRSPARRGSGARPARRTRSTRSRTASRSASRPASPRSSSPAARCATPRSSPRPRRPARRCCSPGYATSATDRPIAAGAPVDAPPDTVASRPGGAQTQGTGRCFVGRVTTIWLTAGSSDRQVDPQGQRSSRNLADSAGRSRARAMGPCPRSFAASREAMDDIGALLIPLVVAIAVVVVAFWLSTRVRRPRPEGTARPASHPTSGDLGTSTRTPPQPTSDEAAVRRRGAGPAARDRCGGAPFGPAVVRFFTIPKRSGGSRLITAPDPARSSSSAGSSSGSWAGCRPIRRPTDLSAAARSSRMPSSTSDPR